MTLFIIISKYMHTCSRILDNSLNSSRCGSLWALSMIGATNSKASICRELDVLLELEGSIIPGMILNQLYNISKVIVKTVNLLVCQRCLILQCITILSLSLPHWIRPLHKLHMSQNFTLTYTAKLKSTAPSTDHTHLGSVLARLGQTSKPKTLSRPLT